MTFRLSTWLSTWNLPKIKGLQSKYKGDTPGREQAHGREAVCQPCHLTPGMSHHKSLEETEQEAFL